MGQSASSQGGGTEPPTELKTFTVEEVVELFQKNCHLLLRKLEIQAIAAKLNVTSLKEKNVLTPSDLAYLFQLSARKDEYMADINPGFKLVIHIIYHVLEVFGSLPFLRWDRDNQEDPLTMDGLIVAAIFHTGRFQNLLGSDYDFEKLLFIALSYRSLKDYVKENPVGAVGTSASNEKGNGPITGDQKVDLQVVTAEENTPLINRIVWRKLCTFKTFDSINVNDLQVNAYDLHQLITLFSILNLVPKSKRSKMLASLNTLLREKWADFEEYSLSLLTFIDININASNLKLSYISYDQLTKLEFTVVIELIKNGFQKLFKNGFLSSNYKDIPSGSQKESTSGSPKSPSRKKSTHFEGSTLVDYASISCISNALKSAKSSIKISSENLIKLYIGKEAGFSIRSLELKVFKWQAPTLLLVSGKRLKQKTSTTNRRYLQFDSEYPRYFRSTESPMQDWQSENDKITYAVLITEPWKISNKKNFGNNECLIFRLKPHFDYFKSSSNPVLNGELIYFNTLGFGLGFGNDQPINKNGVKRYLPGEVSLTIEPNLEFAVFRHVTTAAGSSYFNKSNQPQIRNADFEDRFMITNLEVWGVGSTKELDEQKKQWEWEQKQAEARQSVNIKNMGEERAFLEMVGLVGNHGGSGGSM